MADDLATLQAQLDGLNKARAKGIRSIEYASPNGVSRRVEYRSDSEMNGAQLDLQRRIAALTGGTSRTVKISSSKGLSNGD